MHKTKETKETIRCAIYTRKSTEEGLEQDFNSLDAQRESAEAYIKSQQGEGWECLPEYYDDGGFTGGNMERPALARLLDDIDAGKIDCVVVYKVDRLSRSLMDFARILERFDKQNVAFVSVTQQFNTSTSMGRLTLNVLLSFAQFEREVISERTRDKVAMARKRGKFTGGSPMLGYDIAPEGSRLIVNKAEAEQVRSIFELYINLESTLDVMRELDQRAWKTKTWVTKKGNIHEGKSFNKNTIISLLTNPIYIGQVRFQDESYEGEHEAIITKDIFDKAQAIVKRNRRLPRTGPRQKHIGILSGLVKCKSCGSGMSHSHAKKGNKRYRYYVCQNAQVRGWDKCPHPSLPADEIERFVVNEIREVGFSDKLISDIINQSHKAIRDETASHRRRLKLLHKDFAKHEKRLNSIGADDEDYSSLQNKVYTLSREIDSANNRIEKLKREKMSAGEIRTACQKFDPLWDTLSTQEQHKMLTHFLEQVEFNAKTEEVKISLNANSMKALSQDLEKTA